MRRALLAALALAACGGGGGDAPDAGADGVLADECAVASLSLDEFYRCRGRLTCALLEDCRATDTDHLDCDGLAHEELGTSAQDRRLIERAIADGTARWDGARAAACLVAVAARGCETFELPAAERMTCHGAVGLIADGAGCGRDVECATPGARCRVPQDQAGGCELRVCRPPAPNFASCTFDDCSPGDHCVPQNDPQLGWIPSCRTGEIDQRCDSDDDCDLGFFCLDGTNNGLGVGRCFPVRALEEPCHSDRECAGEAACFAESALGPGRCRAIRGVGDDCDDTVCYGHRFCEILIGDRGQCVKAPDVGDFCGTVHGFSGFCGSELACDEARCVTPGEYGDHCATGGSGLFGPLACNRGLYCDDQITGATNGTCRRLLPDGAQCTLYEHCQSGLCLAGVCAAEPPCGP